MVLYYSATGNTEYIAKRIAKRLDDECLDLLARIKANDYSELHSEKPFVICAPVYVAEMPVFLRDYLKKVSLTDTKDVYFIFTSGGYAGISGMLAKYLVQKKGLHYMGHAEFQMPRNYMASDMYPELEEEEIERRIHTSWLQIPRVAKRIREGRQLKARHAFLFEAVITVPFHPVWTRIMQPAKPFYATDKCIGCGKCEKICPLNNIRMENGKPRWEKPCAHCMACIGNCPVEAIEFGAVTQKKKKYNLKRFFRQNRMKAK